MHESVSEESDQNGIESSNSAEFKTRANKIFKGNNVVVENSSRVLNSNPQREEMRVSVVKDNEKVKEIEVICNCGKSASLLLDYEATE